MPARTPTPRSWLRTLSLAALPVAVLSLYLPVVDAPFVFDDATSVQLNPTIHHLWPPGEAFAGNRPLLNYSYALSYSVGAGTARGHRLGNVFLHLANVLLVYVWLRLTFRRPRFQRRGGDAHWMAFGVALLFAVHPLHTEVVTYISGRSEALAATFVLSAMLCVAWALRSHPWTPPALAARMLAAGALVLAVLSKESAAVAPLLLLAYDSLASERSVVRVLREEWPFYGFCAFALALLALLLVRNPDYANTAGFGFAANPWGIGALEYLYTQPGVVLRYVRLLVLPLGQAFDYDWPIATVPEAVIPPALALGLAAALALVLRRRAPLYALAIVWFFVTLAPTSSLLPIADVIAERRVYLPSVGAFLLLVLAAADLGRWCAARGVAVRRLHITAAVALIMAVGASAALTWRRNWVWQDPLRLWQDSARAAPDNPRVRTNIGARQLERGNLDQARLELEHAAALVRTGRSRLATPRQAAYIETYLAVVYLKLMQLDRAAASYRAAVELGADTYLPLQQTLHQVGDALRKLGYDVPSR